MKVSIKTSELLDPSNIELHCHQKTSRIMSIKQYAESIHKHIMIKDKDEQIQVALADIYYFESVDKKTFTYLKDRIGIASYKLYELEKQLYDLGFLRISKSTIVNVKQVRKVTPMMNRNLMLTLNNGEKLVISRRKVPDFKAMLNMEG